MFKFLFCIVYITFIILMLKFFGLMALLLLIILGLFSWIVLGLCKLIQIIKQPYHKRYRDRDRDNRTKIIYILTGGLIGLLK